MAEINSIKDLFRDPEEGRGWSVWLASWREPSLLFAPTTNSQDARATNQPSTQSLPADTKPQSTQSDSQAPAITEPSTQAPATGETKTP